VSTADQQIAATLYFMGGGIHCADDQNASMAAATNNIAAAP
jgi:hypothetical protein